MSDLTMFPMNCVDEIRASFVQYLDPEVAVIRRPVRITDPNRSVGIFPVNQEPVESSQQIGQMEPVLSQYLLRVQLLVKHADEEAGRRLYAVDTTSLKVILYRDPGLRMRLAALSHTIMGTTERFKKFTVRSQRFLNNELGTQFVYLSVTDLVVETELAQL